MRAEQIRKGETHMNISLEPQLCWCGCLKFAKPGRKYIVGHARKRRVHPIVILNHHLCACNKCDIMIASNKIFANGHNRRGTHPTEETLQKSRKPRSEEAKKNMRVPKTEQGRKNIKDAANRLEAKAQRSQTAIDSWMKTEVREERLKSRAVTNAKPEVKEKRSNSGKIAQNRPEVRLANSEAQKIAQNRPEVNVKRSESLKITHARPEVIEKRAQTNAKPEVKKRRSDAAKECQNRPEVKKKKSQLSKGRWQDSGWREKQLLAIGKGQGILPNKPETGLFNLLQELYFSHYRYSGDYSFIINGKNPDFVNINGQKKCIELFGDYWHKGHNPQDRMDIFAKDGWDTLVIWEHELKDIEKLKLRIIEFHEKESI